MSPRIAQDVCVRLDIIYSIGSIMILMVGAYYVSKVLYVYTRNYFHLNSILKAFVCVIIPDVLMIVNFLPRTVHTAFQPSLQPGPWCTFSAFLATAVMIALNLGTVCIAFTTWRLTCCQPLSDRHISLLVLVTWFVGIFIAIAYWASGILGPYKGLYCCITDAAKAEGDVLVYAVFFITCASLVPIVVCYRLAFQRIHEAEKLLARVESLKDRMAASKAILHQGIAVICVCYGGWLMMYINGALTAAGKHKYSYIHI